MKKFLLKGALWIATRFHRYADGELRTAKQAKTHGSEAYKKISHKERQLRDIKKALRSKLEEMEKVRVMPRRGAMGR